VLGFLAQESAFELIPDERFGNVESIRAAIDLQTQQASISLDKEAQKAAAAATLTPTLYVLSDKYNVVAKIATRT
jgi:hypothetical protein